MIAGHRHWKGIDHPTGSHLRPTQKQLGIGGRPESDQVVVSLSNSRGGNFQMIYLSREQARDVAQYITDLFMLEDEATS